MQQQIQAGQENDGLNPQLWGPALWFSLHSIAAGFPVGNSVDDQQRKARYKDFFLSMIDVLPCKSCRLNARNQAILFDVDFTQLSRKQVELLVFEFHNRVNAKINKSTIQQKVWDNHTRFLYESCRFDAEKSTYRCKCHTQLLIKQENEVSAHRSILIDKNCLDATK